MELIISIPRDENISGSQSMNVIWIGGSEPLSADRDQRAASRRMKKERENYSMSDVSVRTFRASIRMFQAPSSQTG
jgi:hypothetical protein